MLNAGTASKFSYSPADMKTYSLLWGGPCSSKSYNGSFQPLALQIFASSVLANSLPVDPMNFSKIKAYEG